jgi:hypothetical protein
MESYSLDDSQVKGDNDNVMVRDFYFLIGDEIAQISLLTFSLTTPHFNTHIVNAFLSFSSIIYLQCPHSQRRVIILRVMTHHHQ